MSQEIRHFLVFVEQDRLSGSVLPGDAAPPQPLLSSALEDHFGARLGEERAGVKVGSGAAAEALALPPPRHRVEPGRG